MAMASSSSQRVTSIPVDNWFRRKKPLHTRGAQFSISACADPPPRQARFAARRRESIPVLQLRKPLSEYMSLPISYYSVLDGEKVEKLDENTFICHLYSFSVFTYEIRPVLHIRVDQQPDGCCINLLSCKLEGSPSVVAQSDKFETSMVNQISCNRIPGDSSAQQLTSDTFIEVNMKLPSTFLTIPVKTIESAGTKVLEQILSLMLPRFMAQVVKDYTAWASADCSGKSIEAGDI